MTDLRQGRSLSDLEQALGERFAEGGFDLFLVGGAVRDRLLARASAEVDFATNARPEDTLRLLDDLQGVSLYTVGEKFGTIGVVRGGQRAEITTYRSAERYEPGSRKPEVRFGEMLHEDLGRRDFTINAMASWASGTHSGSRAGATRPAFTPNGAGACDAAGGSTIIDPFGGLDDLRRGIIRAVGTPAERFHEDPLRLLRGVRFAAELGFLIEPETWRAIQDVSPHMRDISRERIAAEITAMLIGSDPARALTMLRDSGLLATSVPQLLELDAIADHGPRHKLSLWEHTMRVVGEVPADPILRWAALLHDTGKAKTRSFDAGGRIHFFRHDEVGAATASEVLQSLRMSNETIASVHTLVATHMKLHQYNTDWSDGAVRRLCLRLGPNLDRAIALAKADAGGHGPTAWGVTGVEEFESRARQLKASVAEPASPLDGLELMEHYGKGPGPWIGRIKDALTEKVMDGELDPTDKAKAWALADQISQDIPA